MTKNLIYEKTLIVLKSLLVPEIFLDMSTIIANLVNILKENFPNFSWVGFYYYSEEKEILYLGPFVGKLACNIIPITKGVCGEAARKKETILIKDVNKIPYHIACDNSSKSEIVIPLLIKNKLIGVLDIDSYILNNFDEIDYDYLNKIINNIKSYIEK